MQNSKISEYRKRAKKKLTNVKLEPNVGDNVNEHVHQDLGMVTVREAEYRDKRIIVKTHYEISIDGKPLQSHVSVQDNGTVHCHGLPNYSFLSMVDMVRQVIDSTVDEFQPPRSNR